jgi:hypothetical protein
MLALGAGVVIISYLLTSNENLEKKPEKHSSNQEPSTVG